MKKQAVDKIIEHIDLLGRFTPMERERLVEIMEERTFRRREVIRGISNITSYVFFLSSGSLRLSFTERGRDVTAGFTMANEFVIVPRKLIVMHPDTLTIEFMEPSTLIFLPHLQVKDLIEQKGITDNHEAMIFLNTALVGYCSLLEDRVHMLQLPSAERVRWLEERAPKIFECASLTQIASYLNIAKETLYRIRGGKYCSQ